MYCTFDAISYQGEILKWPLLIRCILHNGLFAVSKSRLHDVLGNQLYSAIPRAQKKSHLIGVAQKAQIWELFSSLCLITYKVSHMLCKWKILVCRTNLISHIFHLGNCTVQDTDITREKLLSDIKENYLDGCCFPHSLHYTENLSPALSISTSLCRSHMNIQTHTHIHTTIPLCGFSNFYRNVNCHEKHLTQEFQRM